ncbi:MAG: 50S ribosomal protein L9 [Bacteroidota bacterium]
MEIILLDHIEKVGAKHDVVKVKDGYGRNYLIPRGLAIVANRTNMARLDGLKKQGAKKEAAIIAAFQQVAAKLKGVTLKIAAKAGESGRLFGSVTNQHIANALKELGVDADKRIIEMPEEVKELGEYTATVKFHPEVITEVPFEVVAEA